MRAKGFEQPEVETGERGTESASLTLQQTSPQDVPSNCTAQENVCMMGWLRYVLGNHSIVEVDGWNIVLCHDGRGLVVKIHNTAVVGCAAHIR